MIFGTRKKKNTNIVVLVLLIVSRLVAGAAYTTDGDSIVLFEKEKSLRSACSCFPVALVILNGELRGFTSVAFGDDENEVREFFGCDSKVSTAVVFFLEIHKDLFERERINEQTI